MLEHSKDEHSALLRHSVDTGHTIAFDDPAIIATDSNEQRLYVKESLKIKELQATNLICDIIQLLFSFLVQIIKIYSLTFIRTFQNIFLKKRHINR